MLPHELIALITQQMAAAKQSLKPSKQQQESSDEITELEKRIDAVTNYVKDPEFSKELEKDLWKKQNRGTLPQQEASKENLEDWKNKYAEQAEKDKNFDKATFNNEVDKVITLNKINMGETDHMNKIDLLKQKLIEENKKLQDDIYYKTGKVLTDTRKTEYEINETDNIMFVRKFLAILYYLFIIAYVFYGNFFPDRLYLQWKIWLYIAICVLFPFFIDYISRNLIFLYQSLLYLLNNTLPKNVYIEDFDTF